MIEAHVKSPLLKSPAYGPASQLEQQLCWSTKPEKTSLYQHGTFTLVRAGLFSRGYLQSAETPVKV